MSERPRVRRQTRLAAASGWMGSALEYYDFFIYAQAAALVFPSIFFSRADPRMGIIGALGTYAVGYVVRPIGAFVLGAWGDTHGRRNVLVVCMLAMGASTFAVGLLPTYQQVGLWAPAMLMGLRMVQGFAVAGEISGASSMIVEHAPLGRRGHLGSFSLQGTQAGQVLAAAVFIPIARLTAGPKVPGADGRMVADVHDAFHTWGWRIPFLLSALVVLAGYLVRRHAEEPPAFVAEVEHGTLPERPVVQVLRQNKREMLLVFCMALTNIIAVTTSVFGAAYATSAKYGVNFSASVYLWIPVLGNLVAILVIPFVGRLSDHIGRRPPIIMATIGCGLLSFAYLKAIEMHSVPAAMALSILMWGALYQGYNAVFPAFYPEQFPTRTRVTGMAIAQNLGTAVSSAMAFVFAFVPVHRVVPVVGGITLALCLVAALGAFLSRETFRLQPHQLGDRNAEPLDPDEYRRLRAVSFTDGTLGA